MAGKLLRPLKWGQGTCTVGTVCRLEADCTVCTPRVCRDGNAIFAAIGYFGTSLAWPVSGFSTPSSYHPEVLYSISAPIPVHDCFSAFGFSFLSFRTHMVPC